MTSAHPASSAQDTARLPSVVIPAHVRTRRVGRDVVLLDLDSEQYFGLDGVGAELWRLLCEGHTTVAAAAVLTDRYDVAHDVLVQDVVALLDVLAGRGLLARRPREGGAE